MCEQIHEQTRNSWRSGWSSGNGCVFVTTLQRQNLQTHQVSLYINIAAICCPQLPHLQFHKKSAKAGDSHTFFGGTVNVFPHDRKTKQKRWLHLNVAQGKEMSATSDTRDPFLNLLGKKQRSGYQFKTQCMIYLPTWMVNFYGKCRVNIPVPLSGPGWSFCFSQIKLLGKAFHFACTTTGRLFRKTRRLSRFL